MFEDDLYVWRVGLFCVGEEVNELDEQRVDQLL